MQFVMPYFYELEYQPSGGEVKTRAQVGFLEHELRAVDADHVSVAAEWTTSRTGEPLRVRCCSMNGDLYLPALTRRGDMITPANVNVFHRKYDDAARCMYDGFINGPNSGYYLHEWLTNNLQLFAKPRGAILASTEALDADRVRAMLDRSFIMDGCVWQKITDLHCEVFKGQNPYGDQLTFSDFDFSKDDGNEWHRKWEARGTDWLSEIRMSLNDVRDWQKIGDEHVAHQFHDLVVHDPEKFTFDGRAWFLHRFAENLLNNTADSVGDWPHHAVNQWLQFRATAESEDVLNYEEHVDLVKSLGMLPLDRSARYTLERGLARWEDLTILFADSDPTPDPNKSFVRQSMKFF